jgi:hypothetical protein
VAFVDKVGDPLGEDTGLSRACAGDNQHGPVDVLDGLALVLVRFERPGFGRSGT